MKDKEENIENLFGNNGSKQHFRVPENYFETFGERLKARIEEEEQPLKKRSLFFYLKPALSMAASIALVMLLVYVPIKKFFPASEGFYTQHQVIKSSDDSLNLVPVEIISYFSEGQFLSAVSDMNEYEDETLSNDSLGEYIAANYNDFDIIANN